MGLDMFLFKTKKVDGITGKDLSVISGAVYAQVKNQEDIADIDISALTGIKAANEFIPYIKEQGDLVPYYSILEEVAYWRKANQIHRWFVTNVQDGIDDCDSYIVSKEQLEKLKRLCHLTLNNMDHAHTMLPTQDGFFFGGTDYDEYYIQNLKDTIAMIDDVLQSVDFEQEVILYVSSW